MYKRIIVGATIAAASWAAYYRVRRWWETWGVDPAEASRALPGDDLVAEPSAVLTRGITIDVPPEAIWPWLVQMGYGRAGWYSYDTLDMRGASAERIVPEWQDLAVGGTLPTHPGGGFEVKVLEPAHALVAYVDAAMAEGWRRQAPAASGGVPAGLAASGGFLDASMSRDFAGSWAFVLEPLAGGRTRFVERFRVWFGSADTGSRLLGPLLGFGVFVMLQRQMTGLKRRAEAQVGVAGGQAQVPATNGRTTPGAAGRDLATLVTTN